MKKNRSNKNSAWVLALPAVALLAVTLPILGCSLGVESTHSMSGPSAAGTSGPGSSAEVSPGPVVTKPVVGSTSPLLQVDKCYLAGQPQAEDFAAFKAAGVKKVISLRDPGEVNWDEKAAVEAAGLEFVQIPMRSPDQMTEEKIKQVCDLLQQAESNDEPVLLHCGAAVRASAVWLAHYCVSQNVSWAQADGVAATLANVPDAWKAPAKSYVEQTVAGN